MVLACPTASTYCDSSGAYGETPLAGSKSAGVVVIHRSTPSVALAVQVMAVSSMLTLP
jgi:hypothetical protein